MSSPAPFYVPPAHIESMGKVNASFKVPSTISVPSDGVEHSVTIATLVPQSELSWFCIPSVDSRVHLTVGHRTPISDNAEGSYFSMTDQDQEHV